MALLKETKKSSNEMTPVIGANISLGSFTEPVDDKYAKTAECAYYKAQARGFEPGHEIEDWLEAEDEISQ